MFAILFLALVCVGFAAALVVRSLELRRLQSTARVRSIGQYGFRADDAATVAPVAPALDLRRLAERLGGALITRFDEFDASAIRRSLAGAGLYTLTPEAYLGYRVLVTGAATGAMALLAVSSPSFLMTCGVVVTGLLVWRVPLVVVERRAKERFEAIDSDLPELIDLLVVSVEAGVGLGGALQMIGSRMSGPLGDELRLTLQEQRMGRSSDVALEALLERCDTPSVRSFVRSLQQGERLGVSIGQILRGLAVEMRTRRRQAAEERAQKAPIKILFPLVFLIFPAMFIVLLGPALFAFKTTFGG